MNESHCQVSNNPQAHACPETRNGRCTPEVTKNVCELLSFLFFLTELSGLPLSGLHGGENWSLSLCRWWLQVLCKRCPSTIWPRGHKSLKSVGTARVLVLFWSVPHTGTGMHMFSHSLSFSQSLTVPTVGFHGHRNQHALSWESKTIQDLVFFSLEFSCRCLTYCQVFCFISSLSILFSSFSSPFFSHEGMYNVNSNQTCTCDLIICVLKWNELHGWRG